MSCAKFAVGAHVNHPAAADNSYPAGTGVIANVTPVSGPALQPGNPQNPAPVGVPVNQPNPAPAQPGYPAPAPQSYATPAQMGCPTGDAFVYTVKCDRTGQVLPGTFPESVLSAV